MLKKSSALVLIIGVMAAVFFELVSVLFASLAGERLIILLALPAAILVLGLFIYDRYLLLFFLIILFRSAMDPFLNATMLGSFGLGAVLNALVIIIAVIAILKQREAALKLVSQTWLLFC